MDIGSILAGLALTLLTVAFIALPFLQHRGKRVTEAERQFSELQAGRDRVLNNLQEMEIDFDTGKILEEDYRSQRQALLKEGAGILRQIDALKAEGHELPEGHDIDNEIEAAVAQIRSARDEGNGKFCPSCGEEVKAGDLFCIRCGSTLSEVEEQA
ncbi:MAG: zinc ribbon domain-containing protein [Anaerolineales bacterium]|nr:zinc ribbon domain-containing protein [Anaerolineales bacterium]